MTKEVIQVPFDGLPARKLRELFDKGYTVSGVAIQRRNEDGTFSRGAATTGGAVMWWPDHGSTDALLKKIAELEAMLDAVGAGGVGQSIKPHVQADTAPIAWAVFTRHSTCRMWSTQKDIAKTAADDLGLPLVPLYTAPQPTRQPLTDEQIIAIADNARAAESGDAGYILPIAFARAVEAAHGITESQP